MVSPNIQELGLSDELLEHYRKEVGEMAVGILDGKPFDSPIHMGILLTVVVLSQLAASPGPRGPGWRGLFFSPPATLLRHK